MGFFKDKEYVAGGQVERIENTIIVNSVCKGRLYERRRGRPRKSWMDDVNRDLASMGIGDWKGLANDRGDWRRIVAEPKPH